VSKFTELHVCIQAPPLEVFYHKTVGKSDKEVKEPCRMADSLHNALKVDLQRARESYVLDVSSAQFGYFQPVIPWSVYKETRIRVNEENEFFKFGFIKDYVKRCDKDWLGDFEEGSTADLFCKIQWRAAERLLIETMKWEKEQKITVKDMLQLPEKAFEIKRKELVEHIDARLKTFLENRSRKIGGRYGSVNNSRKRSTPNM